MQVRYISILLYLLLGTAAMFAQIPNGISYQGVITDSLGNPVADSTYSFTFQLYSADAGGSAVWSESKQLATEDGLFFTILGDVNSFDGVEFSSPYWLGISLDADPEFTPRIPLASVGYSLRAGMADSAKTAVISDTARFALTGAIDTAAVDLRYVNEGQAASISGPMLQDSSITAAKLVPGAVVKSVNGLSENVEIRAGSNITLSDSANTLTITANLSQGQGLTEVVAGNGLIGGGTSDPVLIEVGQGTGIFVNETDISLNTDFTDNRYVETAEANSVDGSMIVDGSIAGIDLADGSVGNGKLTTGAVDSDVIADGSVDTADLADNSVTTAKLAVGIITTSELADNSVTTSKIVDGQVTEPDLADNAVTSNKIALQAVGPDQLDAAAVTNSKLADGAVNSLKIADGGVATADMADGSVTTAKLADTAVNSAKIADGTVSTADLADSSVTSAKISAGELVKSVNGIQDDVLIAVDGGATISSTGNTITITAGSGGGGTGIQGVSNTNNTLDIINPSGPTATINVKDDGITSQQIAANAVGTSEVSDGAITQAKLDANVTLPPGGSAGGALTGTYPNPGIAADVIGPVQIADGAVGTSEVADGAITQLKLDPGITIPPGGAAGGDLTGSFPNPVIAPAAVNELKLANNAVTDAKLAANSVTTGKIAGGAVSTAKIVDGAITQAKLAPNVTLPPGGAAGGALAGTYPNPDIASGAVGQTQIAANAVSNAKLADAAVTSNKLANNAVSTVKITDAAITQAKLAPGVTLPPGGAAGGALVGTYPNPGLADGVVGSANLVDDAVTNQQLADSAVTTGKIVDGAITQSKLSEDISIPITGAAGGDLTGTFPNPIIDESAVDSGKILDGSIATDDLSDSLITSEKVGLNQLVRSLNGVQDDVVLSAVGGATITSNGNTITINAGVGGGGTGVQGVSNTDGTLAIINPTGPTVDIAVSEAGIENVHLAGNAVNSGNIVDGAVTQQKLAAGITLPPSGAAGGALTGTYPNPGIADNAVDTAQLGDNAVTTPKLSNGAVTTPKIAENAITTAQLAPDAVTTSEVADGAITQVKIAAGVSLPPGGSAGGDLTGVYPNPELAAGVVATAELADDAVTAAKIAADAVGAAEIADNAVGAGEIADGAVGAAEIAPNAVGTSEIAANAVTTSEIAPNAVTTSDLQDGSVTLVKIAPGVTLPPGGVAGGALTGTYPNPGIANNAVGSAQIATDAVTSAEIAANAVGAAEIAANAVGQSEIATNGVGAAEIAANAVGASEIANNAVNTVEIVDGAVTQAKLAAGVTLPPGGAAGGDLTGTYPNPGIAAGAVGNAELATDAVSAEKIGANAVGQSEIATNAVGAAEIAANAVGTSELANGSVTAAKIAAGQLVTNVNGVTDAVVLAGGAGTTVSTSGDTITIDMAGSGVQSLTAPGGDLEVAFPNGPDVEISIAEEGVANFQIQGDAITADKIAANAVGASEIAAGAVGQSEIATNGVGALEIAAGAVGTSELATGAVNTADIANGAVTQAKLAAGISVPPNGTAGGDLTGTYPNPFVVGLANQPLSAATPAEGNILQFANGVWRPTAFSGGSSPWTLNNGNVFRTTGFMGMGTATPTNLIHAVDTNTLNRTAAIYAEKNISISNGDVFHYAIRGVSNNTGTIGIGVRGEVVGGTNVVYAFDGRAEGDGSVTGIRADADGNSTNSVARGVNGTAFGPGRNYGIYGSAFGGSENWAGYFTNDVFVDGTLTFSNNFGTLNPMMYIYESGSSNTVRPVIMHSAGFPAYGLLYRDTDDTFLWQTTSTTTRFSIGMGDGRIGIGTDSPLHTLDVRGTIGSNGQVFHSDRRWKRNIVTFPKALDAVMKLRGVMYEWRRDEFEGQNFPEGRQVGVIAQEVEEVVPELVTTSENGYKSVEYAKMVGLLIEAVKELKSENDQLRRRVELLETQSGIKSASLKAQN